MKDNLLKYIFVLSLLLNVSLLGAAGYTYYRQNRNRTSPFGYGPSGHVPMTSTSIHSTSIHSYLFESLSLKPEQRELFEKKARLFHEALDQKGANVDQLRKSLIELMRAERPDRKAIETDINEINRVQQEIQKMIVAHMLDFKSTLDRDQQKKFFDLIQGAMGMRHEIQCP
jgi:Spy/CpxP family protein refolding chaperone